MDFLEKIIEIERFRKDCRKRLLGKGLYKLETFDIQERAKDLLRHATVELSELATIEYDSIILAAQSYHLHFGDQKNHFYYARLQLIHYSSSKIDRKLININNLLHETSKYTEEDVRKDIHTEPFFEIYETIVFKDTSIAVFENVAESYLKLLGKNL